MPEDKKPPKKTVHAQCHYCVQSRNDVDVEGCTGYMTYTTHKPCAFYDYRLGEKRMPIKVMRAYCLDCMGDSREGVRECTTTTCLIHPYRMGTNPARTGLGNTGQIVLINASRPGVSGEKRA